MAEWLETNLANIVIGFLLICAVVLAVRRIIRNKRSGKCSCGCTSCEGCSGCSGGAKK